MRTVPRSMVLVGGGRPARHRFLCEHRRAGRPPPKSIDHAGSRHGFSLLEVLLATGILLGSAIVLSELAGIGARQAAAARDLARVQLLCQSKLNEIVAGIAPLAAAQDTPLDDAPGWTCSVETAPAGRPNLTWVRVSVSQEQGARGRPKTFTLQRWVAGGSAGAAADSRAADASSVHTSE